MTKLCVKGICDKVVWQSFVCHQSQSSAIISATPATQSEGRCRQVPRLPRKELSCVVTSCAVSKLRVDSVCVCE